MNISLRWLCDHLVALSWNDINVEQLLADFNQKVAEIEHAATVSLDVSDFAAARVVSSTADTVSVSISEWNETATLSRDDCQAVAPHAAVLVRRVNDKITSVTLKDCSLDKDGLLPQLAINDADLNGDWRAQWEQDDIILDVDNKSITHRPDMWGHRGFAREIAALLDTTLRDESDFLAQIPVTYSSGKTEKKAGACVLENRAPKVCSALSGLLIPTVSHQPCDVRTVSRFLKIGYRPINALVDLTNYAMADWGRPMHAYDADKVEDHTLIVRMAEQGESLELLDGSTLEMTPNDIVIADTKKPLCLGGVMGGKDDSIGNTTKSVLLEAACFHAASVRRTAARFKVRTESSQRFEKTLDPVTPPAAIQRFVQMGVAWGVLEGIPAGEIAIVADKPEPSVIELSHQYISDRLGFTVEPKQIKVLLEKLAFAVTITKDGGYQVVVPVFRATKDVTGPHDIVEEIARQYGFDRIEPVLPSLPARATNLRPVMLARQLKEQLAYGARMREQRNYAFFNEKVLEQLQWKAEGNLALQNPVSQEAYRLVSTLLPHLLNNVIENMADHDRCDFFEWGTVWPNGAQSEHYELAGVWYDKRVERDFYTLKEHVAAVCRRSNLEVRFEKHPECEQQQWMVPHRGAAVFHGDRCIGFFGRVTPLMLQRMGALPESSAHAFVLNGTYLQEQPLPKFSVGTMRRHQHSTFDVSVMVPLEATVAQLEDAIQKADDLIVNVRLIDFFEKKEWTDQRSIALRVTLAHTERTVSRDEIEKARHNVIAALESRGGQLRA